MPTVLMQIVPVKRSLGLFGKLIHYCAPLAPVLCAAVCIGCANDTAPAPASCLAPLAACEPSLDPTYNEIYSKLLEPRCGGPGAGNACHGMTGLQGGLGLYNIDGAYESLLGRSGNRAEVVPGDPECSPLMERLETNDAEKRMPRGAAQLPAGVRCAVRLWIEHGAER